MRGNFYYSDGPHPSIDMRINFRQDNPLMTWHDQIHSLVGNTTTTTPWYTVTTLDRPVTGYVEIQNLNSFAVNYALEFWDASGTLIPATSSASGTLGAGGVIVLPVSSVATMSDSSEDNFQVRIAFTA